MFAAKNELFTTPSGYQIQRSLRFRSSASAYLNRTPATAGNRKTWTWSSWVKRGVLGGTQSIIGARLNDDNRMYANLNNSNELAIFGKTGASTDISVSTSAVFRDPSAWYHFVFVIDTTQATSTNRVKVYINGVQQTLTFTTTPSQNADLYINTAQPHRIGDLDGSVYFDGYLAEVNFIDGQALTPSSFGAINATTGVWSATKYAGTYGTNGFYLNFTDNSAATATTIGKDFSGNGNNWTPNNISVTAGATYDSMLDAPLGAGGGERGNYCVVNPLDNFYNGGTISNGNLQLVTGSSSNSFVRGTLGVTSGKWYFEATANATSSGNTWYDVGWSGRASPSSSAGLGDGADEVGYLGQNGAIRRNSAEVSSGTTYTTGDVIGVMIDLDSNLAYFSKNGTLINSGTGYSVPAASATTTGVYCPALGDFDNAGTKTWIANFGQRPFSYTPPTGFKALHTGNLGAPVIALPAQNMAATLYSGNSSTQNITNVGFAPDFTWLKVRNDAQNHRLFDTVRGANKRLSSSLTNAEATTTDELTAFTSTGFTLGANTDVNGTGFTYVGWNWKAGGTAVSNTAGSITSSVSANTTAGFSVATFSMASGNNTVGHGLGVTPSMIILKERNAIASWLVFHGSVCTTTSQYLSLNQTIALSTFTNTWGTALPTSSVFSVTSGATATTGNTVVAYCFAPVAGYSAFGSYTGNGSADGPFVFTGFRPRWVMIKRTSGAGEGWFIYDTSRSTFNYADEYLVANGSDAEIVYFDDAIDIVSNGIKVRAGGTRTALNGSGSTYIYMTFAENPFKYANAR
jgi:hypothetical protein